MTLEEVVDAAGKLSAPTVEAALFETGSRFDLSGRTLKELDAASVPDGVVDVMVALSFPGHVTIDRPFRGSTVQTRGTTAASVRRSTRLPSYSYSPYYPTSSYYPYYGYGFDPYYGYRPYSPYYFYLLAVRLLELVG